MKIFLRKNKNNKKLNKRIKDTPNDDIKNKSKHKLKWYIIKIDSTKMKAIINSLEYLKNNKIIKEYKDIQYICNVMKRFKFLFIRAIMNDDIVKYINTIEHVYGFYPTTNNKLSFDNLENYKSKTFDKVSTPEIKIDTKKSIKDDFVIGQYVIINNGFFSGNKGKIISIEKSSVKIEIDFFDNNITAEIDIKEIDHNV